MMLRSRKNKPPKNNVLVASGQISRSSFLFFLLPTGHARTQTLLILIKGGCAK
jgi:hypothetical protein